MSGDVAMVLERDDLDSVAPAHEGHTRYTDGAGLLPLRTAIRDKLARDNGLTYAIDQITVGCGAKQVLFNALFASLDPGDEVVIPTACHVPKPMVSSSRPMHLSMRSRRAPNG